MTGLLEQAVVASKAQTQRGIFVIVGMAGMSGDTEACPGSDCLRNMDRCGGACSARQAGIKTVTDAAVADYR